MTLKEYILKKYFTESENYSSTEFKSKYQSVLKRINAIFNSLEQYAVKRGNRIEIECDVPAPGLDTHRTGSYYTEFFGYKIYAEKLTAIFGFIADNYYKPNKKSDRKWKNKTLDQAFEYFIREAKDEKRGMVDIILNPRDRLFAERPRLGIAFEEFLKKKFDQDRERWMIELYEDIFACKQKAEKLFSDIAASHSTDEESREKIDEVYLFIREFCKKIFSEKIFTDKEQSSFFLFHELFYPEETDFRTVFFESKEEFQDAFYEREAKKLYNNFIDIMKVYQNAIFELTGFVITDINEDEEAMLDYLLDEFGKETSSTPETDKRYSTEEEIKAKNKDAANVDKHILNLMKADKWEEISYSQRLKLWTLIEKLIDQTNDTDDRHDPVTKYERINKYLRKYTVEAVETSLTEIELKLKFPELYKIFKYLRKLNDLYGNIENAEALRSSVEPKVLIDAAKKLKEIFDGHEALYLDYMYHSQESAEYTLKDEINYAGKIYKCEKIKDSENDSK